MPSPFPGMDPYIERSAIWPDFHDSLIASIRAALQPVLRPRYVALTQDRLFVVESDRPIRPDVAVVRTSSPKPPAGASPSRGDFGNAGLSKRCQAARIGARTRRAAFRRIPFAVPAPAV